MAVCVNCNSMESTPIDDKDIEFNFRCNGCGKGSYEPLDGGTYPWNYNKEEWKDFLHSRASSIM